jgi:hypothetical protein
MANPPTRQSEAVNSLVHSHYTGALLCLPRPRLRAVGRTDRSSDTVGVDTSDGIINVGS